RLTRRSVVPAGPARAAGRRLGRQPQTGDTPPLTYRADLAGQQTSAPNMLARLVQLAACGEGLRQVALKAGGRSYEGAVHRLQSGRQIVDRRAIADLGEAVPAPACVMGVVQRDEREARIVGVGR